MKTSSLRRLTGLAIAVVAGLGATQSRAQLDSAIDTSEQALQETGVSQERIDELDEQTQELLNKYRANLKQLEQLERYNASQRRQLEAQEQELASLEQDIATISSLQRSVQPLMDDMLDGLERLVAADTPFLRTERQERVARLRKIMEDPGKSPAQRYRLIIEAYQIENEYGRTVEAYRSDVEADGTTYEDAQLLRIGRLALIFKTDDDAVLKIYDPDARAWTDLDPDFLGPVKTALRVAKEQIPPELLTVPVRAPQRADAQEG